MLTLPTQQLPRSSPEMFNLVLETEGVNPDLPELFHSMVSQWVGSAMLCFRIKYGLVQLVLLRSNTPACKTATYDGEEVATCLLAAVEFDRLGSG